MNKKTKRGIKLEDLVVSDDFTKGFNIGRKQGNTAGYITLPHYRYSFKGNGDSYLYVVVSQYGTGEFSFADFWDLPYTSKSYSGACKLKKEIVKEAITYGWLEHRIRVCKITL